MPAVQADLPGQRRFADHVTFRCLFRGKRLTLSSTDTPDWSRVRNVLLVRLRSIGDTVLMPPCLEALKDCQPAVRIAVVSEPLAAPVLEDQPSVDELFIAGSDFRSRATLIRRL